MFQTVGFIIRGFLVFFYFNKIYYINLNEKMSKSLVIRQVV